MSTLFIVVAMNKVFIMKKLIFLSLFLERLTLHHNNDIISTTIDIVSLLN